MMMNKLSLKLAVCLSLVALGHALSTGSSERDYEGQQQQQQHYQHQSNAGGGGGGEYHEEIRAEGEIGGYKGAPKSPEGSGPESGGKHDTPITPVAVFPPIKAGGNNKGDLPPMFNLSEWAQLILSPFEMVKKIADSFKIPLAKFVEKIGKGLVFGAEAMLTPLIASLKIVEKIFVPDQCRMKLLCQIGSKFAFIKDTVTRFSPNLIRGTLHIKALTEGITGQNCDLLFKECGEPKLKKPFEELKSGAGAGAGAAAAPSSGAGYTSTH